MGYLKEEIRLFCSISYAFYLLATHKQPRHVVIYYHSVKRHQVDKFEKQMAYLADKCFVAKPSEIMNEPPDGSKIVVVITFDDVFTGVMNDGVPILRKYEKEYTSELKMLEAESRHMLWLDIAKRFIGYRPIYWPQILWRPVQRRTGKW